MPTRADERIPSLLSTPAAVRFISCEPLLGSVDLSRHIEIKIYSLDVHETNIDWVIVGGESGKGARPMHPDWARRIRDQCQAAVVPFFFKQWGEWAPSSDGEIPQKFGPECEKFRCMCSNGFVGELNIGSTFIHSPHSWPQCFPDGEGRDAICNSVFFQNTGKRAAGRHLDGKTHNEFPEITT